MHVATELDGADNTPLVLAVLPVDCEAEPRRAERFTSLAEAARGIAHPGLVPIVSHGVQLGVPYVLYRFAPARTLEEVLAQGPLAAPDARQLGQALLAALLPAHARGLHHLDLTPANVLLGDGPVQLLGLGIAELVRKVSPDKTGPTGRGSGVDARRYLAPELLRGEQGDARSDVYSVGALLHRAVVGVAPGRPPVPGALVAYEAVPGLRELVERALEMQPDARFQSAQAMQAALEALREGPDPDLEGLAPRAEPLQAPRRDPDRAGLPTGLLLAGAVVLLAAALVAMFAFGTNSAGSSRSRETAAATDPQPPLTPAETSEEEGPAEASPESGAHPPPGADEEEAAAEPLAGTLPDALQAALEQIEAGDRFDAPGAFDALYGYTRRAPEDPRGYLVLARAFMARGYRSAAFSRYAYAFRLAPEAARRDPQALPDLVDIAGRATDPGVEARVVRLLRAQFGPAALPAVEAAEEVAGRRVVRQRLGRLRAALEPGGRSAL